LRVGREQGDVSSSADHSQAPRAVAAAAAVAGDGVLGAAALVAVPQALDVAATVIVPVATVADPPQAARRPRTEPDATRDR
jgi:hypothetical protein